MLIPPVVGCHASLIGSLSPPPHSLPSFSEYKRRIGELGEVFEERRFKEKRRMIRAMGWCLFLRCIFWRLGQKQYKRAIREEIFGDEKRVRK
eukprot:1366029-Amorphochlora_amoeboformis.AAC.1